MKKHIFPALAILAGILLTFAFVACEQPEAEVVEVAVPTLPPRGTLVIKGTLTGTGTQAGADLTIDFRFNTLQPDYGNYLKWKIGSGPTIEDSLDATTGASKFYTTEAFSNNTVSGMGASSAKAYFTSLGLTTLPARAPLGTPVRGLLLFPVDNTFAPTNAITRDAFQAFKNPNGSITIRFVHNGGGSGGTASVIVTNPDGTFNIDTSGKTLSGVTGGSDVPISGYRIDETDTSAEVENLDWVKVMAALPATAAAAPNYDGTLRATLY